VAFGEVVPLLVAVAATIDKTCGGGGEEKKERKERGGFALEKKGAGRAPAATDQKEEKGGGRKKGKRREGGGGVANWGGTHDLDRIFGRPKRGGDGEKRKKKSRCVAASQGVRPLVGRLLCFSPVKDEEKEKREREVVSGGAFLQKTLHSPLQLGFSRGEQ